MAVAQMFCVVPEGLAMPETEEPAYPASILNDPQTRDQFRAVYIEQPNEPTQQAPKPGFWRRQFSEKGTAGQKRFDWLFSVILPVICFAFDPFVFRGNERFFLANFAVIAIPLSFASIMGTMLWLLMGDRLGRLNTWLSGLFAVSAVVSLAIGMVLFPFSLIGMLFIIGFLGFTPLFMSFSLLRNAIRAYRAADARA